MTTVDAPNVHNVAVEGTFDDCQDLVKALFADAGLRERVGPGRHELDQLGPGGGPDRLLRERGRGRGPVRRGVPTGQLRQHPGRVDRPPRRRPHRAADHRLQQQRHPHPLGPERRPGPDRRWCPRSAPAWTSRSRPTTSACCSSCWAGTAPPPPTLMARFRGVGSVEAPHDPTIVAASLDDAATLAEIADLHRRTGYLADPHTAVGIGAARACRGARPSRTGRWCAWPRPTRPSSPTRSSRPPASARRCPPHLADLLERPERYDLLGTTSTRCAPTWSRAPGAN